MTQPTATIKKQGYGIAVPTLLLTLGAIAAYAISFAAALQGNLGTGWAITINALMAYFLFTSMHEAGHLNISGNRKDLRWIDEVVGWISGLSLLAPFYIFKVIHFRHHAFTNDPEKDPDHWLASKSWLGLLFHSTTIFPVYMIKGLQLLLFEEKLSDKVRNELRIGYMAIIIMVALIVVAGTSLGWNAVLLYWIVPAFIAQALLAFAFDWLPHHPHEERAPYLNTRVIDIPGLDMILLGQNYHLIHHLHPRIPFYKYKEKYVAIEHKCREKGVRGVKD